MMISKPVNKTTLRIKSFFTYKFNTAHIIPLLFVLIFAAFSLLPFIYLAANAFKPLDELFLFPPRFFVRKPTLDNFLAFLSVSENSIVPFSRYIFNSVVVVIFTVTISIAISTSAAYAVSKLKLKFASAYFNVMIMALMFSPFVIYIPRYLIIDKLGMMNSYWALIIPALANSYYMFLVKQFIDQFPDSLLEAAKIDGASEFKIFRSIVVPNLKPVIATLTVFAFMASWNDGFGSIIYITSQELKTLPVGISNIVGGGIGRAGAAAAAALVMILPTIIVFCVLQSKVVSTMTYSGIKG